MALIRVRPARAAPAVLSGLKSHTHTHPPLPLPRPCPPTPSSPPPPLPALSVHVLLPLPHAPCPIMDHQLSSSKGEMASATAARPQRPTVLRRHLYSLPPRRSTRVSSTTHTQEFGLPSFVPRSRGDNTECMATHLEISQLAREVAHRQLLLRERLRKLDLQVRVLRGRQTRRQRSCRRILAQVVEGHGGCCARGGWRMGKG